MIVSGSVSCWFRRHGAVTCARNASRGNPCFFARKSARRKQSRYSFVGFSSKNAAGWLPAIPPGAAPRGSDQMRRRVSLSVCRQTGKNRRAHHQTPNIAPTGAAAIVGGCPHTPRASRRQFVHGQSSRHTGTTASFVIQEARHVSLLPRSCPRPPLPPPRVAKWWLPERGEIARFANRPRTPTAAF